MFLKKSLIFDLPVFDILSYAKLSPGQGPLLNIIKLEQQQQKEWGSHFILRLMWRRRDSEADDSF